MMEKSKYTETAKIMRESIRCLFEWIDGSGQPSGKKYPYSVVSVSLLHNSPVWTVRQGIHHRKQSTMRTVRVSGKGLLSKTFEWHWTSCKDSTLGKLISEKLKKVTSPETLNKLPLVGLSLVHPGVSLSWSRESWNTSLGSTTSIVTSRSSAA